MPFRSIVPLAALLMMVASASAATADRPTRPNFVVILADDMGFSDLGCYGGEIRTPNLDALAARGLRFAQFYNNARCCPTRASLLTGLYPHQAGVGHMMQDRGSDGYRGDLNRSCVTIAEALRPAGYRNYAVGKWHVTRRTGPEASRANWPLGRGFDRFYGMIGGGGSYYDPATLARDNALISPFADPEYRPQTYYFTDAISDHAVRFVGEHTDRHRDRPFFLYVAYTAAHWPMHALPEDIARYKGKYDIGFEAFRKARFARSARFGLIDPEQGLSGRDEDWDRVANKEREAACMEVYAATVDRMDQGIGKLVAELKRTGQFENTLILYLQDNGGCAELMGRGPEEDRLDGPRPDRPTLPPIPPATLPDGLVPPQTRDGYPVRQGPRVIPGPADTYVAYGRGWANVSNTPFREYKHWVHEGGISSPLVAHWPAGIRSEAPDQIVRDPGHVIDLMATCVDLAGASYPVERDGRAILAPEGISLRPVLEGHPLRRPHPLCWEHEGNRAIRDGKWKLVAKHRQPWELYDLAADRPEQHDLAAARPAQVEELSARWQAWADRVGVRPWPVKPPEDTAATK